MSIRDVPQHRRFARRVIEAVPPRRSSDVGEPLRLPARSGPGSRAAARRPRARSRAENATSRHRHRRSASAIAHGQGRDLPRAHPARDRCAVPAHTAMLIAPCSGSTSAGMSSLEVLKAGGIGGTSSSATMADSGMSRTVIGTPGGSTFENCRAMPLRRASSSAFSTTSSKIAKTGSEPGQYTATSEGSVRSSGECVHCEPRRTDTSKRGQLPCIQLYADRYRVSGPSRIRVFGIGADPGEQASVRGTRTQPSILESIEQPPVIHNQAQPAWSRARGAGRIRSLGRFPQPVHLPWFTGGHHHRSRMSGPGSDCAACGESRLGP